MERTLSDTHAVANKPSSQGSRRRGGVRLEIVLAVVALWLFFQIFPSLWQDVVEMIDVRNWTRPWLTANLVILAALVAIRFAPDARRALSGLLKRPRRRPEQKSPPTSRRPD